MVYIFDSETGRYLSQKHSRIAEIIHDYDSSLELAWIPPDQRTGETHPFAILHRPPGREPYVVRKVKEDEVDERLLGWLFANDNERGNPLALLQKVEQAREIMKAKEEIERQEEQAEIATAILTSPLHTYKGPNGKVYR